MKSISCAVMCISKAKVNTLSRDNYPMERSYRQSDGLTVGHFVEAGGWLNRQVVGIQDFEGFQHKKRHFGNK